MQSIIQSRIVISWVKVRNALVENFTAKDAFLSREKVLLLLFRMFNSTGECAFPPKFSSTSSPGRVASDVVVGIIV